MSKTLFNIPNILSAYRIAVIPVLTLLFYIGGAAATWMNVVIFALACISDLLDGIIARHTGQTTIFGKFLDSTSDKILIGGTLMLLVAFGRIDGIWIIPALIIYLREILVAGLREFLGLYNVSVEISMLGKWKAAIQMIACGFLIAGDYGDVLVPHTMAIGLFIFLIATVVTVLSGWQYITAGIDTIRKLDAEGRQ